MDIVDNIIKWESGELTDEETIDFFRELYLSDILKGLQGTYQRTFNALCDNGYIDIQQLKTLKKI